MAVLIGILRFQRLMSAAGYGDRSIYIAVTGILGGGFALSHVVALLFYQSHQVLADDWLLIFRFWDGMSSVGGFIGAALGLVFVCSYLRLPGLGVADLAMTSLVSAWVMARLGCTVAHDHLGHLTDFALAIQYPGGARHNLGLYEFLLTGLVLVPVTEYLRRTVSNAGTIATTVCLIYTPMRFSLDFLRASDVAGADPRYGGLTAAQYGCLFLFGLGIYLGKLIRRSR